MHANHVQHEQNIWGLFAQWQFIGCFKSLLQLDIHIGSLYQTDLSGITRINKIDE